MGKELAAAYAAARETFEEADDVGVLKLAQALDLALKALQEANFLCKFGGEDLQQEWQPCPEAGNDGRSEFPHGIGRDRLGERGGLSVP